MVYDKFVERINWITFVAFVWGLLWTILNGYDYGINLVSISTPLSGNTIGLHEDFIGILINWVPLILVLAYRRLIIKSKDL